MIRFSLDRRGVRLTPRTRNSRRGTGRGLSAQIDDHRNKQDESEELERGLGDDCGTRDGRTHRERHRVSREEPGRVAIVPQECDKGGGERNQEKESLDGAEEGGKNEEARRHYDPETG